MAADPRIHKLMDLADEMIEVLEDIQRDMSDRAKTESKKPDPADGKIGFFNSQAKRAGSAIDLIDEDLITILIGLNNLSGPIKYMEEE